MNYKSFRSRTLWQLAQVCLFQQIVIACLFLIMITLCSVQPFRGEINSSRFPNNLKSISTRRKLYLNTPRNAYIIIDVWLKVTFREKILPAEILRPFLNPTRVKCYFLDAYTSRIERTVAENRFQWVWRIKWRLYSFFTPEKKLSKLQVTLRAVQPKQDVIVSVTQRRRHNVSSTPCIGIRCRIPCTII